MSSTLKLSDLQQRVMEGQEWFEGGDSSTHALTEFYRQNFDCFECEFVVRPNDNALVVHLKHLPPLLRKPVFFRCACTYWREKIGAFKGFEAYYTDKVDEANEIYSLDMIFTEYYPAIIGDIRFMERHVFKIASDLNYALISELQEHAARKAARK